MNLLAPVCRILVALAVVAVARAAPHSPRLLLLDGQWVGTDLVVVGERGTILRSPDLGQTWQGVPVPTDATLTGVSFAAGSPQGWAVGHDALILASADAGLTWQKQWQGENLSDSFLDVLALDARHVIAVGAYGLVMVTEDGGRNWMRRQVGESDLHFNRITRNLEGTLFLAGEHGLLLRSADQGGTWQPIDSPYDGSFYGILPVQDHTILAYGLRGRVYRSIDDGSNWSAVPNEQRTLIATAVRLQSGVIIFAGQSRAWFISRDDGKTLASWSPLLTAAVAELIVLPNGSLLALGEAGAAILPPP